MALVNSTPADKLLYEDDGVATASSIAQQEVEETIHRIYEPFLTYCESTSRDHEQAEGCSNQRRPIDKVRLNYRKHASYLRSSLRNLPCAFTSLDASRPWMCFWMLHAMSLLGEEIDDDDQAAAIVCFLARCQSARGGFGGGPGQQPHLAPTYAAVMALSIIGTHQAYTVIDRARLREFLCSCVEPSTGAVSMHEGGEDDVRGAYCALAVGRLLKLDIADAYRPVAGWVARCQTYEGGFGGVPGMEAHGGYSFCSFAALVLLGQERLVDLNRLSRWAVRRQMRFEGGFQGRTNKLVDACYSYWQGGLFPLLQVALCSRGEPIKQDDALLCCGDALQSYVLICCQSAYGGLFDKPGKSRDFYHSCYALSGISCMQNFSSSSGFRHVLGPAVNRLEPTHPVFNVRADRLHAAHRFFQEVEKEERTS